MQGEALELLAWKWEGLKRALEAYGAELLLPLAVMFGPAHVWGVTYLAATSVVRSAQEISLACAAAAGPWPGICVHSEEKAISVIVYTVLVNYALDVAASFYFHPWLWFCPVCAWNSLGRIFLCYFQGISGFFLAFLHPRWTQCLLLPQPFCKTCSVPGFIE